LNEPRTPESGSRCQASRYSRCIRLASDNPENTRISTLSAPTLAPPAGRANTSVTASAALPLRWNLRMKLCETTSRRSAGANVETRMSNGIRAVSASEAMTMARSIPRRSMKALTQRPANVASNRRVISFRFCDSGITD